MVSYEHTSKYNSKGMEWGTRSVVKTPNFSDQARKNNLAWKCLEHWNAPSSIGEGKNDVSANQLSSSEKVCHNILV